MKLKEQNKYPKILSNYFLPSFHESYIHNHSFNGKQIVGKKFFMQYFYYQQAAFFFKNLF